MPRKLEETTLVYRSERNRFDDVAILSCDDPYTGGLLEMPTEIRVKVECDPDELISGLSYRFYGSWVHHEKYGRQFHAQTFIRLQPHSMAGIVRYLTQAPGVGHQTANDLWNKFGGDAVRILREHPEIAAEKVGGQFTEGRAKAAAAWLEEESELESCSIDLIDLLGGKGFPRATARKAIREWGNLAAGFIRRNPYILMRFRGCGFTLCDRLYLELGHSPHKLKRQSLCAWSVLARDKEGHTWLSRDAVVAGLRAKIGGTNVQPYEALKLAVRAKIVRYRKDEMGQLWFADARRADAEDDIARVTAEMLLETNLLWPDVSSLDCSDHQRQGLAKATTSTIGMLRGGPGAGKTYTLARLVSAIIAKHGWESVALCAPTGKAAVRMSQALSAYGVGVRARTVHSLLGVKSSSEGEGWVFEHGEGKPLPHQFVICDESSMVGTPLMAALMRAIPRGGHLLLIGDEHQLPPVEHGAPLRDFIKANVPTGELTEVRRNSGSGVLACHAIREERPFRYDEQLDPDNGKNLKLIYADDSAAIGQKIIDTVKAIKARGLVADPVADVQVIVAVNEKSECSRKSLNKILQGELNSGGYGMAWCPFRVRDKIVCLKNHDAFVVGTDDAPPECNTEAINGKVRMANGELGTVTAVDESFILARFEAPDRLIKIFKGGKKDSGGDEEGGDSGGESDDKGAAGFSHFDLGYTISCHKSQGSEWPVVIVALDPSPGAGMVTSREWIYTALSRFRHVVFAVGVPQTVASMCHKRVLPKRKTFLVERIGEWVATMRRCLVEAEAEAESPEAVEASEAATP